MPGKLTISTPYLETGNYGTRLCSIIEFEGREPVKLWFETSKETEEYITKDRADCFVVSCLPFCLSEGVDLVSEAPISTVLLHNLNEKLIPALAQKVRDFHFVRIEAKPVSNIENSGNRAALCWSAGVDSMYSLHHLQEESNGKQPNLLLIANCGVYEQGDDELKLFDAIARAERTIVSDTGIPVIWVNSNIHQVFDELYLSVLHWRLGSAALFLQGLLCRLYISSADDNIEPVFDRNYSSRYEDYMLPLISTNHLKISSYGGSVRRIEKLRYLSDKPLAGKYVHPCIMPGDRNCGSCIKCMRDLSALYGLGKLDHFREVFDIDAFSINKDTVIGTVLGNREYQLCEEVCHLLEEKELVTPEAVRKGRAVMAAKEVVKRRRAELAEKLIKG